MEHTTWLADALHHAPHAAVVGVTASGRRWCWLKHGTALDTRFALGSLTKSLAGALVQRLVAQGRLGWHDALGLLWPAGPVPDVTVLECLTHRTGLPEQAACQLLDAGLDPAACLAAVRRNPDKPFAYDLNLARCDRYASPASVTWHSDRISD